MSASAAVAGSLVITAFLGGSVLLNVFKEELPVGRASSYPWFPCGVIVYGCLLAAITHLGG